MDLESRVDYLERQNRWMKAAILAIALIAVAMGQFRNEKELEAFKKDFVTTTLNQIEALRKDFVNLTLKELEEALKQGVRSREFVLVNENGDPRGVWKVNEDKSLFSLLDADRKPLFLIGTIENSHGLEILDAEGHSLVSLNADQHAGSLVVRSPDDDSRASAMLRVGSTGPELILRNNEGNLQPLAPW